MLFDDFILDVEGFLESLVTGSLNDKLQAELQNAGLGAWKITEGAYNSQKENDFKEALKEELLNVAFVCSKLQ